MDKVTLKIETYQKILSEYVERLADKYNNALGNELTYQAIIDTKNNHFQLVKMGWNNYKFIYAILIHLDISPTTGNIWIQQNNTEILLEKDLKIFNVPEGHFVLGFRSADMREHSNFAVA